MKLIFTIIPLGVFDHSCQIRFDVYKASSHARICWPETTTDQKGKQSSLKDYAFSNLHFNS